MPTKSGRSPIEACAAAEAYGVSLANHRPVPLTRELMAAHDLVVVMEVWQLKELRATYPEARDRTVLLPLLDHQARGYARCHIDDPFNMPPAAYAECFRRVDRALDGLITEIRVAGRDL